MADHTLCPGCGKPIIPGNGCTIERMQVDGIGYPRIPYETYSGYRCEDCSVSHGQFHHTNCAMEICPVCAEPMGRCHHKADYAPYRTAPPAATSDIWALPLSAGGKVYLIEGQGTAFVVLNDGQGLAGRWLTREEAYRLAQALLTWVDET